MASFATVVDAKSAEAIRAFIIAGERDEVGSLGCLGRVAWVGRPFKGATGGTIDHSSADLELRPIGLIRSALTSRRDAPKQGDEGAPDVWLEIYPWAANGLLRMAVGDEVLVITWLHGPRETCRFTRAATRNPLTGVFATRSPDRPNPLGLHPVVVREIDGSRLRIGPMEAIDGTPVIDIKPVLPCRR